jgi:CheY-like chemotaxis protein
LTIPPFSAKTGGENTMHGAEFNILIVEDNPITQESLKETFELAFRGLTTRPNVWVAGSAEEGLEILTRPHLPDILILDLQLPGMSGAEMLEVLTDNSDWKHIPVFPYSSLWDADIDQPMNRHMKIVRDWLEAEKHRLESGGWVSPVVPKPQGSFNNCRIHPKLLLFIAGILFQQGHVLSEEFQKLVASSASNIFKSRPEN